MKRRRWPIYVLLLLGLLLYLNSFRVPFQFDGIGYILKNDAIRDVTDLMAIRNITSHPSRFVGFYSFALNYHFHQYDIFGYHLVNVFIHMINALLVYWFVLLIFSTPRLKEEGIHRFKDKIALLTALLFVSHPIQTQAVTYIYQRFASMSTMFYLISMCLYMSARLEERGKPDISRGFVFLGAAVAALLGMFTKQITLTLPLMIVLVEFCFFGSHRFFSWQRGKYLIPVLLFLLIIPSFFSFDVIRILAARTNRPKEH